MIDLWPLVPLTVLFQVLLSLASIIYLWINRSKAKEGDRAAAKVVILPNFKYLLWTCLVCQMIHLVLVGHAFTQMPNWKKRSRFESHKVSLFDTGCYFLAILVTSIEYNVAGTLLIQKSLAKSSFVNSRIWACIWGFVFAVCSSVGFYTNSNAIFFTVDGCFYTAEVIFYAYMITNSYYTMRTACVWYAWYSILWRVLIVPTAVLDVAFGYKVAYHSWVLFRSVLFPVVLYDTLLRETDYWRGTSKSLWLLGSQPGRQLDVEGFGFDPTDLPLLLQEKPLIDFAYLQMESLLDIGASSRVYKGSFRSRTVAVKLFTPPKLDSKSVIRCLREAKYTTLLKHPNIVEFYGLAVSPPDICIVQEYCHRGSLYKVLGSGQLSVEYKMNMMQQATNAIGYLHGMNPPYIHRDIKSKNFLVTRNWTVKLGDFGESRIFSEEVAVTPADFVGSYAYMGPEIISTTHYDTKADIYSLGIVLWEVLTQERPYQGIKQTTVLRNVVDAAQGGCSLRPQIPEWVSNACTDLLKSCWHSTPHFRPNAAQIRTKLIVIKDEGGPIKTDEVGKLSQSKGSGLVQTILAAEIKEMDHHAKMLNARRKLLKDQLEICAYGSLDNEAHKELVRKHIEQNSVNAMRISRERSSSNRRQRFESMGSAYSTYPPAEGYDSFLRDEERDYAPIDRRSRGLVSSD
ncbi:hypothetical protein AAMO2058_001308000 [Amorphochlora amoebiformis]